MEGQRARPTRVMLAEPDARARSALRLVLQHLRGFAVCGELTGADHLARHLMAARPDVLVIDWEQVQRIGHAALRALRSASPRPLVIALGSRPEARADALSGGADYFVAKNEPPDVLLDCLAAVAARPTHVDVAA